MKTMKKAWAAFAGLVLVGCSGGSKSGPGQTPIDGDGGGGSGGSPPTGPAIAVVGEHGSDNIDGTLKISTDPWAMTAGSMVIGCVRYQENGSTVATFTDTLNGTYGDAIETVEVTGLKALKCYAFPNSLAGDNVVTATFSGNENSVAIWAIEIANAKPGGAIDTHNHNDQTSPGVDMDAITVASTNSVGPALVVALVDTFNGPGGTAPLAGTGFTTGVSGFGITDLTFTGKSEWKRVGEVGDQVATFTATDGHGTLEYVSIVINVLEAP